MPGTLHRLLGNAYARAIAIGGMVGLLLLVIFLTVSRQKQDTLVLEVRPLVDANVVRVYVGGAVTNPGLYTLPRGSRVAEAIDAAGGVAAGGDASAIGMAALIEDADQVIVPARAAPQPVQPTQPAQPAPFVGGATATILSGGPGVASPAAPTPTLPSSQPGLINVNTASASELETLPGIGPALGARIVEYRMQNGPFQTIEELEAVRGISARMVEDLRALVTVGP